MEKPHHHPLLRFLPVTKSRHRLARKKFVLNTRSRLPPRAKGTAIKTKKKAARHEAARPSVAVREERPNPGECRVTEKPVMARPPAAQIQFADRPSRPWLETQPPEKMPLALQPANTSAARVEFRLLANLKRPASTRRIDGQRLPSRLRHQ